MKTVNTLVKILTALAAIAGVIYVIATYGDKIVAWAKSLLNKCCCTDCCCCEDDCCCGEDDCCCTEDACCKEECCCEAAPAEEVAPAEETVSAEEADFEG